MGNSLEDARRRRIQTSGHVEAICTLCEVEGRPYVHANYEYIVASTLRGDERLITACPDHANKLDNDRLPYRVIRRREEVDWAHAL
jgi:hypothetical protein